MIVELLREGHQVIAALRNAATKKDKLLGFIATEGLVDPSISFVEYDLSRDFKLDSLLSDAQTKIHVIYHLAASFNWGISKAEAERTNIKSGLALIEWAATLKRLSDLSGLVGIVWLRRRKNRLMSCIANMVVMRLQNFRASSFH